MGARPSSVVGAALMEWSRAAVVSRLRPIPATSGLWDKPTNIGNVKPTPAAQIILNGAWTRRTRRARGPRPSPSRARLSVLGSSKYHWASRSGSSTSVVAASSVMLSRSKAGPTEDLWVAVPEEEPGSPATVTSPRLPPSCDGMGLHQWMRRPCMVDMAGFFMEFAKESPAASACRAASACLEMLDIRRGHLRRQGEA